MPKLIDLTRPVIAMKESDFPPALTPLYRIVAPSVEFVDHQGGAKIMSGLFNCTQDQLPAGEGWAEENLSISSHLGTHVDAPWHYGSTTAGEKAKTIEQIALEDLYCDAVVLDLTELKGTGQRITVDHVK